MNKKWMWGSLFLGVWLSLELLCWCGLLAIGKFKSLHYKPFTSSLLNAKQADIIRRLLAHEETYTSHHPILGWSIKPYGRQNMYSANGQGLRADREYSFEPLPGTTRIATFGDSFTHGNDIPIEATWQVNLEKLLPGTEVLNFGVGGYGPDQAYLRYQQDGTRFHPRIVLLGYMVDGVERIINTFRPLHTENTGIPLGKPRFILRDDTLELVENPLPRLDDYRRLIEKDPDILKRICKHDYYYHKKYFRGPFDFLPSVRLFKIAMREHKKWINDKDKRETLRTLEKIFQAFTSLAREEGSAPVIIIFPTKWDLYHKNHHRPARYTDILAILKRNKFSYIDMLDAFPTDDLQEIDTLFTPKNHYSRAANRIVAATIVEYLKRENLF